MAKNLLSVSTKKKVKRITPRGLDQKYLGEEPTWENQQLLTEDEIQSKLASAYNWYNYFANPKMNREFLTEFMVDSGMSKAAVQMMNKVDDHHILPSTWKMARMITMGYDAPKERRIILFNDITQLVKRGIAIAEAERPPSSMSKSTVTNNLLADVESMVDANDEQLTKFYELLKNKAPKPAMVTDIANYYQPWVDELHLAYLGKGKNGDLQLREAYEHMTKKQIKDRIALFEGIINDCKSYVGNNRKAVVRKPRKIKPKSDTVIVKNLKYQKEDVDLKIVSIDPTKIVGAKELWTFNTKYNVLAHYVSDTGLSVKGTTLQNVNDKLSSQKKLRKPDQVLPDITGSTSKAAIRSFEAITTKASVPNGRIADTSIILRAVK
jgi:hypothetical protein